MGANEKQIAGNHYKQKAIQPWDYITSNNLGYLEGNIVKYVSRWKEKGGVSDLKKAQHYLEKLLETTNDLSNLRAVRLDNTISAGCSLLPEQVAQPPLLNTCVELSGVPSVCSDAARQKSGNCLSDGGITAVEYLKRIEENAFLEKALKEYHNAGY